MSKAVLPLALVGASVSVSVGSVPSAGAQITVPPVQLPAASDQGEASRARTACSAAR
jgi:hypothetical protein